MSKKMNNPLIRQNVNQVPCIPSCEPFSHSATVLVFDSGVGGLSILQEMQALLPNLTIIYAFDNQFFPYGEKSDAIIIERVLKVVEAVANQYALDMVVIACNTASTISLDLLRQRFTFPIVGVIPAIKPAAQLTQNNVIGLLATKATIQRDYTSQLISNFAAHCRVELMGSSELVLMAEAKLAGTSIDLVKLADILLPWMKLDSPPDTIVLGCTHFPLLKTELMQVLPVRTLLVDSGQAVAQRVLFLLGQQGKVLSHDHKSRRVVFCTKLTETVAINFAKVFEQYGFEQLNELVIT